MMKLKCHIDEFLKKNNMTQRELAERSGITEVSISRYCNATRIPKATECIKIAQILNCKAEELYSYDGGDHKNDSFSVEDMEATKLNPQALTEKQEALKNLHTIASELKKIRQIMERRR